ncbi:MAG: chromate transporter [Chloroflexia bacterium]|nr:chromate transporter [Chloroflexia bacterium]
MALMQRMSVAEGWNSPAEFADVGEVFCKELLIRLDERQSIVKIILLCNDRDTGNQARKEIPGNKVADLRKLQHIKKQNFDRIGNALPGPIAPQVAAYVGYKVAGLTGAIAAVLGTVGPTTILMLVMIVVFFQIKDSPSVAAMLKAVRPVVVGLLLWTTIDIARSVFWKQGMQLGDLWSRWDGLVIALVTFAILSFTKVNPAVVVGGAAILGWLVYRR